MGANFSLGEAVLGTSVDLKGLADGVKQARSDSQGFIDGFAGQLQTLGKVAAGVGAAIAAALVGGGLALAIDAAPVEGIAGAFAGTTASIGSSLEEMQAAFDEATAGMVSHRDAMLTFNQAAQLVSKEFAAGLPGAMELLGKVSAATGKDMAYLMDSLVTGIGRLSGPILDNLAIQTDATAAYEAFAEAIGKSAGDLTKQEQQMALFAQVMEKLRENTASMPDATDTTAASLARFQAAIQNLKDDIGVELLPVLQPFLDIAVDLGEDALPILKDILEDVTPFAEGFANAVKGFVKGIEGGMTPMDSFERQIKSLFPHDTVDKIMRVIEKIQEFKDLINKALEPIKDFVTNNFQLSDVLTGLGIAIATFVVPALISLAATAWPVVAVFLLLTGAAALLRKAWEEDFLGIRSTTTRVSEKVGKAIEAFSGALDEGANPLQAFSAALYALGVPPETITKIQEVIDKIQEFIDKFGEFIDKAKEFADTIYNNILGAIDTFKGSLAEGATPLQAFGDALAALGVPPEMITGTLKYIEDLRTAIVEGWAEIQPALDGLAQALSLNENTSAALALIWETSLRPAFETVGGVLAGFVIPKLGELSLLFAQELPGAIVFLIGAVTFLVEIWQGYLWPALVGVGEFIFGTLLPFLGAMARLIGTAVAVAVAFLADKFNKYLLPVLQDVWGFLKKTFGPILEEIGELLGHRFSGAVGKATFFAGLLKAAFDGVVWVLQELTKWANNAADALQKVKPDPSMTPGSPTPFEMGLRGVMRTMQEMNRYVPDFLSHGVQLEARAMVEAMAGGPPLAAEGGLILHNYGQITLQGGGDEGEGGITGLIRQFKDMA